MRKTKLIYGALFGVLALTLLAIPHFTAKAQVPSANPPYNIDLGALITNTARGAGTTSSAQQNNLDKQGAICALNQTAQGGLGVSATLAIQNFDTASGQYYTIAVSGASSPNNNVPIVVMARSGNQTASLPAGVSASQGLPLARYWRVQQVLTGSGGVTTTGTVGCVILK